MLTRELFAAAVLYAFMALHLPEIASAGERGVAGVPSYHLDVISEFDTSTTIRGASENGIVVGDQIVLGQSRPFAASLSAGLKSLPLPPGFNAGVAMDVNQAGLVVGTVSDRGSAMDFGQPAYWTPDGLGGWQVSIPPQFDALPSPLGGELSIDGGQIVAVNELGLMVGWSRFQGFQGGPTTLFDPTDSPVDLRDVGFDATVRAINDNNVIVGGQIRLDLDTSTVTSLGLPDPVGGVGFTQAIAFAVNNNNETVVAADLASIPTENWLTYFHNDLEGYVRLNPAQLPGRFVGFYDNNDLGDVAATGGILFRSEGELVLNINELLAPAAMAWQVNLGFITNDRRIYTTAQRFSDGVNAVVRLSPVGDMVFLSDFEGP